MAWSCVAIVIAFAAHTGVIAETSWDLPPDSSQEAVRLELFAMPLCPYGRDALAALLRAAQEYPGEIKLDICYIAAERDAAAAVGPTRYLSSSGIDDVLAGIRAVVIEHLYPTAYLDYLRRGVARPSASWEEWALEENLDTKLIDAYCSSEQGLRWYEENTAVARTRQVASPDAPASCEG